jgi:predicted negative regulator of RcsB-dependent stress response
MAVYDLEEQEQLAELKTWWTQYGNLVTGVLIVVALAAVGWQGWNWWQRSQAAEASALFGGLQQAVMEKDPKRIRDISSALTDKYGSTAQAAMAALLTAKAQVDAGDLKNARAMLTWAVDNAKDEPIRDIARLRLAGVLSDDNAADEALKQLAVEPSPAFAARYAELRGDILAGQNKVAEAKSAYEAALAKSDVAAKEVADARRGGYRDVLKAKLESLGGAAK